MIEFVEYALDSSGNKIYARIDEDGLIRYTCEENDPSYQNWLQSKEK